MVRIDHHEPNSRWYSGAGIFRNVWFKEAPVVHLTSDGVYIATKNVETTSNWKLRQKCLALQKQAMAQRLPT